MTRGYVLGVTGRIPAERMADGTVYIVRMGKAYPANPQFARTFVAY